LEEHQEIHRFVRQMIAFRKAHAVLREPSFYTDDEIRWLDPEGESPDWDDSQVKHLACLILDDEEADLLLIFNAGTEAVSFELPDPPGGGRWHLAVDTSASVPDDIAERGEAPVLDDLSAFFAGPRSSAILLAGG
jgi:glycogen operon protein